MKLTARPEASATAKSRRGKASNQRLMRRVHVWTSMVSLALVLFFSVTGLLLNHPSWTFGEQPSTTTSQGTLPAAALDGSVDLLAISEYIRDQGLVHGQVTAHSVSGTNGSITYAAPGSSSSLTFDTATGAYQVTVTHSGFIAAMGDLHRGYATSTSWGWVIDLTAVILIVIAATGLIVLWLTRSKDRNRDLWLAAGGLALAMATILLA